MSWELRSRFVDKNLESMADHGFLRRAFAVDLEQELKRLEQLELDIKTVDLRMSDTTQSDPTVQRLLEQAGVGLVTALLLRAVIGRFDRFRSGKPSVAPRPDALQRLQRQTPGRRRPYPGRPRRLASRADSTRQAIAATRATLERTAHPTQEIQTGQCGHGGRCQPLGEMLVPRDENAGRLKSHGQFHGVSFEERRT